MAYPARRIFGGVVVVALAVVPGLGARDVPFAADATIDAVAGAKLVRAADVDRDGDVDLVGETSSEVYFFERDPAVGGGYVAHLAYDYANDVEISGLEIADLDRDGDDDVVVYRINPNLGDTVLLDWLENDGTPGVGAWPKYNIKTWEDQANVIGQVATGLAVGDVDGDGDLDVAVGRYMAEGYGTDNGQIEWIGNDGTPANGGWDGHVLRDWRYHFRFYNLALRDVDLDGDTDLVGRILKDSRSEVAWWENDGTPANAEWAQHGIETDLTADNPCRDNLDVGDVDRDGDPDVLLGTPSNLFWWENDGTPDVDAWTRRQLPAAASGACSAQLADVDRDGDLDVATDDPGVGWYENDGTPKVGSWTHHLIADIPCDVVRMADLDGDGDPDLTGSDYQSFYRHENLEIHRNDNLLANHVAGLDTGPYDVLAADLDGDGRLDLVTASSGSDDVSWFENDGSPTVGTWPEHNVDLAALSARAVAVGDLDRDGDLDLVAASFDDDTVAWYENDGTPVDGGWTKRVVSNGAGGATDVVVADFDRDGDLDLAGTQYNDYQVGWYRNEGGSPPTFTPFFVDDPTLGGPRALVAFDLDRDGDLDLAATMETADSLVWYDNDGTPADGQWTRHLLDDNQIDAPRELAAADLDADGDLDLAVASSVTDEVLWFENTGSLADWFGRRAMWCSGARGVAAGDFDIDGDVDLIGSCNVDGSIVLGISNGATTPTFTDELVSVHVPGARHIAAADLDGDGDLDAAVAGSGDDDVVWFENRGGQFALQPAATAASVEAGVEDDLFRVWVRHRGRSGDGDLSLVTFWLLFEEAAGDPLNQTQFDAFAFALEVYHDTGDGVFDPDGDVLVNATVFPDLDVSGRARIDFVDGAAMSSVAFGEIGTYFVTLFPLSSFGINAPATLRVTLLTEGALVCTAEDRTHDIPLLLEAAGNVSTATLEVHEWMFRDTFESGTTTLWSRTGP